MLPSRKSVKTTRSTIESASKRCPSASRILAAAHETAQDLRSAGFIEMRRMREYDARCLAPVPDHSREHVRALRDRLKLSQAVLATVLNTSRSTVRQWEIGEKHPSGPLLELRRPLLSSCAGTSRC